MKKCVFLLFFVCLCSALFCASSPFLPHDKRHLSDSQVTKLTFQGLILLPSQEDLNPAGYENVHGVLAYKIDLPGSVVSLKKELRPLIGKPLDEDTLAELKRRVQNYYHHNHHPLVRVTIPEQDISAGVVQMIVKESQLGKVEVKGNKWFSKKSIEKQIRLQEDENLASDVLDQDLWWLNRNPFRQVDAVYLPGEKPGTTDIELLVHDRFPLRTYFGIDNTGNDVTGNNRLFIGVDWGKVFWTDQRLSYQFVTSSDFTRFYAHTLYYEAPLPWRHLLNIYGGYSHVDADYTIPNVKGTHFHTKGWSMQASLRYTIPLKPMRSFLHQVIGGFDFKRTNNNLALGGRPVISDNNVNLTQFMLGYNLGYEVDPLTLSFEIEGFYSPGQWVADQSNADYQSLRSYSKNDYVYARSAFVLIWDFYQKWTFHTTLRWQLASINLLPSEEYGVGGYNTVRGYKERIVNGDNVFILNLEVRTPPVSIFNPLAGYKKFHDEFVFLVFFDYGFQQVKRPVTDQNKTNNLASIGPGVRYQVTPYLTFRADWGFQLHRITDPSVSGGPHQRLSFSLVAGY